MNLPRFWDIREWSSTPGIHRDISSKLQICVHAWSFETGMVKDRAASSKFFYPPKRITHQYNINLFELLVDAVQSTHQTHQ